MDRERLTESWGAGKRVGLAAIPGNQVYWFACCRSERINDPALAGMDIQSVQKMFAGFHDPIPEVMSATPSEGLIWTDIVDLEPLAFFTRGRVVLLGDAAHAVTPDLGQGAGLAIEDASVLSSLLGRYPVERAFQEYNRQRVARATRIASASRLYATIAQWRSPAMVRLRNRIVGTIPEWLMERQLDWILDQEFDDVRAAA
jgi:2-polyprenyl-6-methoxyphenol hydroxylase-like FAD-dependent oxidoreductase